MVTVEVDLIRVGSRLAAGAIVPLRAGVACFAARGMPGLGGLLA